MHELSVTEAILDITLRHAAEAGASSVTDIFLVIGQLSSIIDDSVQFYWDMVSEDTLAEGAKLHFKRVPIQILCMECQQQSSPQPGELACPNCGSANIKIVAGEEFFLEAINIEK